jgi:hypothetical protein
MLRQESRMANPKEPSFDVPDEDEDGPDDYQKMHQALHQHISDFAEKNDLPDGAVSLLLLDIGVTLRMIDYATSVEKPSGSGLKLELDRLRREVDEIVRNAKKGADEFVSHAKDAIREAEQEEQGH